MRIFIFILSLISNIAYSDEQNSSQIFQWIENNNAKQMSELTLHDPSISLRNEDGLTPIHWAAGLGNLKMTKLLIEKGADIFSLDSKMGVSVLHKAVYSGKAEVVSFLLQQGALINLQSPSNGDTPIHDALYFKVGKDLSVIETLLKAGASLNIKNRAGLTPIESARVLGDTDAQKLFAAELEKRFTIKGKTLMQLVRDNKLNEVIKLLEDPKTPIEERDEEGFTPLLWAARQGYTEIVKVLLKKGANPNTNDLWMGANAGHKSGFWNRPQTMKVLVDNGLNLNARGGYNGYTPLHDAVTHDHYETAEVLIKAGARTDIRGHDGKTALDIAKNAHFEKMVKLLSRQQIRK